jgi:hypothetical protein
MPQRALYELAEAVLGRSPEMHWSVDEDIARRETSRLFDRLFDHTTTPQAALEVFMIGTMTKVSNSIGVIEDRYNALVVSLSNEQQDQCPALSEFFEFFTAVSQSADYCLSETITRRELAPLFQACHEKVISSADCQDAVFDYVTAKRDTILITLQLSVQRLNKELSAVVPVRAETENGK